MNNLAEVAIKTGQGDADDAAPTLIRQSSGHASIADAANVNANIDGNVGVGEIVYSRTKVSPASRELLAGNRVVTALEPGAVSDAYKILAIQVVQRLREKGRNSVAVVSPREGEGKTLTAVNLAISLAAEVDHTVLLVDADLRSPSVHRCFGFVPEFGLSDHLLSNVPVERILVNPGINSLVVLPGGRPISNSAEMLGSLKMQRLVQDLKARYASRLIVFDLPPVLAAADMLAFAPFVDAAVMVVEESSTSRDDILRAAHMLSSVELIGTVLNKSTVPQTTGYAPIKKPGNFFTRLFRRD